MAGIRKYPLNEDFFESIDSEIKAYWLGFIFADGYITKRRQGQSVLGIKQKEREILDCFQNDIGCDKPIGEYLVTNGWGVGKPYYQSAMISNKIVHDLISHGCVERKSLVLKYPSIDPGLDRHFIRGYFDGDGSIFEHKARDWSYLGVTINGTQEFLASIHQKLPFINADDKCIYKELRTSNNCWQLKLLSNKRCRGFEKYIYQDATRFMKRKRDVFKGYKFKSVRKFDTHGNKILP